MRLELDFASSRFSGYFLWSNGAAPPTRDVMTGLAFEGEGPHKASKRTRAAVRLFTTSSVNLTILDSK